MHKYPHIHIHKPTFNLIHINEEQARGKGFIIHFRNYWAFCKARSPWTFEIFSVQKSDLYTALQQDYLVSTWNHSSSAALCFRETTSSTDVAQLWILQEDIHDNVMICEICAAFEQLVWFSWIFFLSLFFLCLGHPFLCWLPLLWLHFKICYPFSLMKYNFNIITHNHDFLKIMTTLMILIFYITLALMCFRSTLNWQKCYVRQTLVFCIGMSSY